MKRNCIVFALCVLAVFTLSCERAAYRTMYNNMDRLSIYQIDKYFDLNDAQEAFLKKRIAQHHIWHQRDVLPLYADIIRAMQKQVRTGLTPNSQEMFSRKTRAEMDRLAARLAPDAAEFMMTLSAAQVKYFRKELDSYNADEKKKMTERDKNPKAKRLDHVFAMLDFWYGGFSSAEKDKIKKITEAYRDPYSSVNRMRYLKETQEGCLALLGPNRDKKKLEKYLAGWISRNDSFLPVYYRRQLAEESRIDRLILLEVDRTVVTEKHRKEGAVKIQELLDIIVKIRKD